eukprot:2019290-Rhodomonas_salina.6
MSVPAHPIDPAQTICRYPHAVGQHRTWRSRRRSMVLYARSVPDTSGQARRRIADFTRQCREYSSPQRKPARTLVK